MKQSGQGQGDELEKNLQGSALVMHAWATSVDPKSSRLWAQQSRFFLDGGWFWERDGMQGSDCGSAGKLMSLMHGRHERTGTMAK